MKEASIRDAKSSLTSLLREVEKGRTVRLTRHGKPVAVLLSEREYERLATAERPKRDFLSFLPGWRREMIAKGLPFASDDELHEPRDRHAQHRRFQQLLQNHARRLVLAALTVRS